MVVGLYSPYPGCGKTTLANILVSYQSFKRLSFAQPIKDMARPLLACVGVDIDDILKDHDAKNNYILPVLNCTLRHVLQTIGTDWGRDCIHVNMWRDIVLEDARRYPRAVIDDMRFPNEFQGVDYTVRIVRPAIQPEGVNHRSEGALEGYPFNMYVTNNRIDDLLHAAEVIAKWH